MSELIKKLSESIMAKNENEAILDELIKKLGTVANKKTMRRSEVKELQRMLRKCVQLRKRLDKASTEISKQILLSHSKKVKMDKQQFEF